MMWAWAAASAQTSLRACRAQVQLQLMSFGFSANEVERSRAFLLYRTHSVSAHSDTVTCKFSCTEENVEQGTSGRREGYDVPYSTHKTLHNGSTYRKSAKTSRT